MTDEERKIRQKAECWRKLMVLARNLNQGTPSMKKGAKELVAMLQMQPFDEMRTAFYFYYGIREEP
jgi:hypothetical protein